MNKDDEPIFDIFERIARELQHPRADQIAQENRIKDCINRIEAAAFAPTGGMKPSVYEAWLSFAIVLGEAVDKHPIESRIRLLTKALKLAALRAGLKATIDLEVMPPSTEELAK